jgi:uncharacterized damage-inducible protein DinB
MIHKTSLIVLFSCLALSTHTFAADAVPSVFRTAFLSSLDDADQKLVSLADAFAENQYDWRPSEGVRSVKEAFLHVASANYFLGSRFGAALPPDVHPDKFDDTVKTKAEVVAVLKNSIAFARDAVANFPESDLGTEVNIFGQPGTKMRLMMIIGDHANEHLGQLIAYARSNNVVPPWSK